MLLLFCTSTTDAPDGRQPAPSLLCGKRAVIVEDEGITQMQLKKALTRAGLLVVGTALNGHKGVEVALKELPDLVLMDIRMPVMDCLEAARQILETIQVCVVMLTAFTDEAYRERAKEIGTSGYVLKPMTADTLLPLPDRCPCTWSASDLWGCVPACCSCSWIN